MKIKIFIIAVFSLLINSALHSSTSDTTFKADLNFDGREEVIKFIHNENNLNFILKINNSEATDTFEYGYFSFVEIIDIDRNDNLKEIVVKGVGESDNLELYFYQFSEGKIISCGRLTGYFGYETKGNKELLVSGWMGFWEIQFKYRFDTDNKSLTIIPEEFYNVNVKAEVKNPFPVYTNRYDQSPVRSLLKTGTKITLVKADISPKCRLVDGYEDEEMCDWYLLRTDDGIEGWSRLRDFREYVDGLIWAG